MSKKMKFHRKNETELIIKRENWENSRAFRKAPFKERYEELLKFETIGLDFFTE